MAKGKDAKAKDAGKGAKSDDKSKGKDAGGGKGDAGKLKGGTSINVRHILCEKFSKKEEALGKLNDGAKFDEVARELSEDKARQGGSLGWKPRNSLLPEFEQAAWALEPSTVGIPKWAECKTREGYHILMVEGRK